VAYFHNVYTSSTILTALFHFTSRQRFDSNLISQATIKPIGLNVRCPIFLVDFNQIWIFSTYFRESYECQISRKFIQWEPPWYIRTDRLTYLRKLRGALRDYVNAAKKRLTYTNVMSVWLSVRDHASVPKQLKRSKFYLPTDAQKSCFKRMLKFTLKQLLHVSV